MYCVNFCSLNCLLQSNQRVLAVLNNGNLIFLKFDVSVKFDNMFVYNLEISLFLFVILFDSFVMVCLDRK